VQLLLLFVFESKHVQDDSQGDRDEDQSADQDADGVGFVILKGVDLVEEGQDDDEDREAVGGCHAQEGYFRFDFMSEKVFDVNPIGLFWFFLLSFRDGDRLQFSYDRMNLVAAP
jgi:hypothetical protein